MTMGDESSKASSDRWRNSRMATPVPRSLSAACRQLVTIAANRYLESSDWCLAVVVRRKTWMVSWFFFKQPDLSPDTADNR